MSLYTKEAQARLMIEHHEVIREQAAYVKHHMEQNDLREVIRHMAIMLGELRTSHLTPKVYYELYTSILPHLLTFGSFLVQLTREGTPVSELYESVQRTAHVLPRLYLMIAAGNVYIRMGQAPAPVVMEDLLSHIKAIQHPARGLFVRAFLIQSLKDYLPPLVQGAPEVPDGIDSITFLIDNLGEMNRLWVRMQQPVGIGPGRGRRRRERERQDLRQLVGANLMRLSALDGLDVQAFGERVLPRLLIEVSACKDRLSQGYLLESLLSVFPAEWHLATVDILTSTLRALVPDTALGKGVFLAILQRVQDAVRDQTEPVIAGLAGQPGLYFNIPLPQLPFPPKIVPGLPQDIDLFAILLRNLLALAEDPDGPFRVTTGITGEEPTSRPAYTPDTNTLMAGCAAVLEVLLGLLHFSSACYDAFLPQICATLQAAGRMTRQLIGLPPQLQVEGNPSSDEALQLAQKHVENGHIPSGYKEGYSASFTNRGRKALAELLDTESGNFNSLPVPHVEGLMEANGLMIVQPHGSLDSKCSQMLTALLTTAQELLGFETLKLLSYASALSALSYPDRKEVAFGLVTSLLSRDERVNDYDDARRLFAALAPLILGDDNDAPGNKTGASRAVTSSVYNMSDAKQKNFEQEQMAVAKLLLLLGSGRTADDETNPHNSTPDTWEIIKEDLRIYKLARNSCAWGRPKRIVYAFPSIVQLTIALLKRMESLDPDALRSENKETATFVKEVYSFLYETLSALALAGHSEVALDLFVDAAIQIKDPQCSEELLGQAFALYETMAHDTTLQARCLYLLLSALEVANQVQGHRFEGLLLKSVTAARRLPSASLAVPVLLSCSYLYARIDEPERTDAPRVLDCLRVALRIADTPISQVSTPLYLDCLAGFLAAFERSASGVTAKHVSDLFVLAEEHVSHYLKEKVAPGMVSLSKEKQHNGALYDAMQVFKQNPNADTEKQLQTLMSSVDCSTPADIATYFNALVLKAKKLPKDKLDALQLPQIIPDHEFIPDAPVEAPDAQPDIEKAEQESEQGEEEEPAVESTQEMEQEMDNISESQDTTASSASSTSSASEIESLESSDDTDSAAVAVESRRQTITEALAANDETDDSDDDDESDDESESESENEEVAKEEETAEEDVVEMDSATPQEETTDAVVEELDGSSDREDNETPPPVNVSSEEEQEEEVEELEELEEMPPIPDHVDEKSDEDTSEQPDKQSNFVDQDTTSTHVPYGAPDDESS